MTDKNVRVLLIEDNSQDLFLTKHQVRKAVPNCVFTTICKKKEMEEKVEWLLPDLVISDFHLGVDFTALDAMLYLREQYPEAPFIIVSGAINNDRKVATLMSEGANAFLSKDDLSSLPALIDKVLTDAESRINRRNEIVDQQNRKKILVQKIAEQLGATPDFPNRDKIIESVNELGNLILPPEVLESLEA